MASDQSRSVTRKVRVREGHKQCESAVYMGVKGLGLQGCIVSLKGIIGRLA